jgi:hypothetical protein
VLQLCLPYVSQVQPRGHSSYKTVANFFFLSGERPLDVNSRVIFFCVPPLSTPFNDLPTVVKEINQTDSSMILSKPLLDGSCFLRRPLVLTIRVLCCSPSDLGTVPDLSSSFLRCSLSHPHNPSSSCFPPARGGAVSLTARDDSEQGRPLIYHDNPTLSLEEPSAFIIIGRVRTISWHRPVRHDSKVDTACRLESEREENETTLIRLVVKRLRAGAV